MTSILCLNVGSSSLKVAVFEDEKEVQRYAIDDLTELPLPAVDVVAHRIVHGGLEHDRATKVDETLIAELQQLVPLAPLHLPPALEMLTRAQQRFGGATHVACFDTAFHRSMPDVAQHYALPEQLTGALIKRYGFHGLSCEHAVSHIGPEKARRAIIAHLGSGCSVTAIKDGQSIDTSMGFTPSGGVVMATRPGDIDPGVVLYLLDHGHDIDALTHAINFESGLNGIAGEKDMRELLRRSEAGDSAATLAIDVFCYKLVQQIGAYATTLGGINTLVFTGGIGEHATAIRDRIVDSLQILQPFDVVVVAADEEKVMARQALALI